MYSNDYLLKNGITDIEELVGKEVYFVFPKQGIKVCEIRRVQYSNKWCFITSESHRVSEIGKSIFFTKEEAEKYQMQQLYEYTKEQRKWTIGKKIQERNKELKELNRLLKKYPTEESRSEISLCDICRTQDNFDKYDACDPRYWLCEDCNNNYNNFECDLDRVKKLYGEF